VVGRYDCKVRTLCAYGDFVHRTCAMLCVNDGQPGFHWLRVMHVAIDCMQRDGAGCNVLSRLTADCSTLETIWSACDVWELLAVVLFTEGKYHESRSYSRG
jgi:hypothetical protein